MRLSLVLFLLLCGGECLSQLPFAQANQFPLLFNPSLAGGKGKKRVALAWNHMAASNQKGSNYGLSYDQPIKGLGSGIGIYSLIGQWQKEASANHYTTDIPSAMSNGGYALHSKDMLFGFTFAPKYNLWDKKNPNVIKYTFSPSVFFEYENNRTDYFLGLQREAFNTTSYDIEHPGGVPVQDSAMTQWISNKSDGKKMRAGIGLQVNAKNVLVLLKTAYEMNVAKEEVAHHAYTSPDGTMVSQSASYTPHLHAIVQSANVGITFPQQASAKLYFTPIIGYGYKVYLNPPSLNDSSHAFWQTAYKDNFANYLHASANFRTGKILWGGTYTKSGEHEYYGAGLGLQSDWVKLMVPLFFAQDYAFVEASANFFF